eukprot:364443-Chlamydomonas_euryale.AAC.9
MPRPPRQSSCTFLRPLSAANSAPSVKYVSAFFTSANFPQQWPNHLYTSPSMGTWRRVRAMPCTSNSKSIAAR